MSRFTNIYRSAFAYMDVGASRSAGMRVSDEGAVNFDAGSRAARYFLLRAQEKVDQWGQTRLIFRQSRSSIGKSKINRV